MQALVHTLRDHPYDPAALAAVLAARVGPKDGPAAAADQLTATLTAMRLLLAEGIPEAAAAVLDALPALATMLRNYEANEAVVGLVATTVNSEVFLGMLAQAWAVGRAAGRGLQWYEATMGLARYAPVRRELWYDLFVHNVPWAVAQDPAALYATVLQPLWAHPRPAALAHTPAMQQGLQRVLDSRRLETPAGPAAGAAPGVVPPPGRPVAAFGARGAKAATWANWARQHGMLPATALSSASGSEL